MGSSQKVARVYSCYNLCPPFINQQVRFIGHLVLCGWKLLATARINVAENMVFPCADGPEQRCVLMAALMTALMNGPEMGRGKLARGRGEGRLAMDQRVLAQPPRPRWSVGSSHAYNIEHAFSIHPQSKEYWSGKVDTVWPGSFHRMCALGSTCQNCSFYVWVWTVCLKPIA